MIFFLEFAIYENVYTVRDLNTLLSLVPYWVWYLTGSGTCLQLPSFNLECMLKSWSYLACVAWNCIPNESLVRIACLFGT